MSIAVSAIVKPSRVLRLALALFATLNLCAALALALQWTRGPQHRGVGAFRFTGAIALACAAAAGLAARAAAKGEMRRRIDISGVGEIRLTVQHNLDTACERRLTMVLAPGSTVWPQCQLWLLRPAPGGVLTVLIVLPDSVAPAEFRALAVAIKAIAGRDNKFYGKNKIL